MIIAFDIRPLMGGKISGVEMYIHHLLKNLFLIDQENFYILFANATRPQQFFLPEIKSKNVVLIQTRIPNKILNLSLAFLKWPKLDRLILKHLQKKHPQLKIPGIDVFFMPDLRLSALSKNVRKITVVHDLSFKHFPQFFSRKTLLWYKLLNPQKEIAGSNKIIAVSEFTKRDLINSFGIPAAKIQVIYEGISAEFAQNISAKNLQRIKQKYALPPQFFLFLATLEPRKNMKRLIEAFISFKKKHPSALKLVLAGTANQKIFSAVKIENHPDLVLTGFVEEYDKPGLIGAASTLLYPSLFEGFGLPLLEAMKCGTPIITSGTSAMPEIVGKAAILVDPLKTEEIALAMEKILDPAIKHELKQAMAHQIKKFSWQTCAQKTLELISGLRN